MLVENGKQVVEAFKESDWDEYDCILMDVMMPIMDGYTATRRIRGLSRPDAQSIPIIALTANAFAEDRKKAMEAGKTGRYEGTDSSAAKVSGEIKTIS